MSQNTGDFKILWEKRDILKGCNDNTNIVTINALISIRDCLIYCDELAVDLMERFAIYKTLEEWEIARKRWMKYKSMYETRVIEELHLKTERPSDSEMIEQERRIEKEGSAEKEIAVGFMAAEMESANVFCQNFLTALSSQNKLLH